MSVQTTPSYALARDTGRKETTVSCHKMLMIYVLSCPSTDSHLFTSCSVHVTALIYCFINNCKGDSVINSAYLLVSELHTAEQYWNSVSQTDHFLPELKLLRSKSSLPKSSSLLPLHPYLDDHGLLRVGVRLCNSSLSFSQRHPIILHQKHPITRMIIHTEHIQMLHAGPTLLMTSLSRRYHIIGLRKAARFIIRQCVICRRQSAKPEHQLMGQLPLERVNPDIVFENVGIDYAGPI